jgi:hypothetical protein
VIAGGVPPQLLLKQQNELHNQEKKFIMNTRTLWLIVMVGSPFLGIDYIMNNGQSYHLATPNGVFSLLYVIDWLCSIICCTA